MDLAEYPIKIYHSKRMAERIEKEVLNYYSAAQETELPTPITPVLADRIGGIKQPLDLMDLEQKANNLRNGTMEDKAIYLYFMKQLIEKDCMPVDEAGQPYDLSLMHIPAFHNDKFLDNLCIENPELLQKVIAFYSNNKKGDDVSAEGFAKCMNLMKAEQPTAYVQLYNYMVGKKVIPSSSMLSTISLTKDQFAYLVHIDKAKADEHGRSPLIPPIIDYVTNSIQGPETLENINNTIATMRYGSLEEQETYYEFCKMALGLPIMLTEELPSVQEQRAKLLRAAEAMEPASAQKS